MDYYNYPRGGIVRGKDGTPSNVRDPTKNSAWKLPTLTFSQAIAKADQSKTLFERKWVESSRKIS